MKWRLWQEPSRSPQPRAALHRPVVWATGAWIYSNSSYMLQTCCSRTVLARLMDLLNVLFPRYMFAFYQRRAWLCPHLLWNVPAVPFRPSCSCVLPSMRETRATSCHFQITPDWYYGNVRSGHNRRCYHQIKYQRVNKNTTACTTLRKSLKYLKFQNNCGLWSKQDIL